VAEARGARAGRRFAGGGSVQGVERVGHKNVPGKLTA
jgi:hypothetical protein